MPKKRNIKSRLIDITIILFCIAGSFLAVRAFWLEYNRTFTKLNENPVGTITFKKRTAQRKIIDRIAWDSLKQSSGIYNGDTIRTIEASEAVISFRDETTIITLGANTLIQIFYNDIDGTRIDFSQGSLVVDSAAASDASGRSVTITQGSSEIIVQGQASLDKKDEGLSLFVLEGSAVLDGEIIETGDIIILDEQGERDTKPAIAVTSINPTAYNINGRTQIRGVPEEKTPVVFEWNEYNFNFDTFVIIETSLDPAFKNIAQTASVIGSTNASVLLDLGDYFWRAYPANTETREPVNPIYPQGTLEIISIQEIAALEAAIATDVRDQKTETEQEVSVSSEIAIATAPAVAPTASPTHISSAQINQIFYNTTNWEPYLQGQSASIRNRVTMDYKIEKEIIQGQAKDVLTITVDLPRSTNQWRQGLIDITDDIIIQRLRTAEGIRFKMIGDAGRGWFLMVQTSNVKDFGYHEFELTAAGEQPVEINIPFSSLRQPAWANRIRFNRNNITILQIRRHAAHNQYFSGSSTIKIFDFEIY